MSGACDLLASLIPTSIVVSIQPKVKVFRIKK
jgi:hypothetical protein